MTTAAPAAKNERAGSPATPTNAPKKFVKRDTLIAIEAQMQASWAASKIHQSDPPAAFLNNPIEALDAAPRQKFMATFPYPYMNGRLHLGHSFSLSKAEFAVRFERLQGKTVLFPMGFHCTGMPIKACADKLAREIELFGKNFEGYKPEQQEAAEEDKENVAQPGAKEDPTKVVKKASKVAAKSTGLKYQFQIMESMGVPREEVHKFADAVHWLYYFPPLATKDITELGMHIDWRRSFITTDVNPYYDSFIRWQFNKLKAMDPPKIRFGERYTIYSPLDGQPCMDHDRASGEGVGVQEYTGIKLQVLLPELEAEKDTVDGVRPGAKLLTPEFKKALGTRTLYLVAATLRPETMYGQTNCYVGTDIEYGVYEVSDTEAWVVTPRAARNMAYQSLFPKHSKGTTVSLATLKGSDLVGVPLKAPLSSFDKVYTLPMEGVLVTKGTGVVTSVPSDSPDDYITLMDLVKKHAFYKVLPKWVEPFLPPKAIIQTPNYGNLAAVKAVEEFKVKSQKDKPQLALAKEAVYKEGFYSGVMIVGKYSGQTVQDVKPLIRQDLIKAGLAFVYCEPEGVVISRSGDDCVVTLADQWFMDYGETSWRGVAEKCLAKMETFGSETRAAFEKILGWLHQWACSRSYGLGSRLPWDPSVLIESLSDSTIYMAYYTVAHHLHGGTLDGSKPGPMGIEAKDMTDDVWDYILNTDNHTAPKSPIPVEKLNRLKREFMYFYPVDLRVSGKDLVGNHLTFFIYNHVALFKESRWPQGVRINGHLLLNSEKMSKSTGNFMTLRDALETYGADATRFALADAGDSIEDANFVADTANSAILRLHTQKEWAEMVVKPTYTSRTGEFSFLDRVFEHEMTHLTALAKKSFEVMQYREAVKYAFYELQSARDWYRDATTGPGDDSIIAEGYPGMHKTLLDRFLRLQAIIMSPITPHWSEYVWTQVLKEPTSIFQQTWPEYEKPIDTSLLAAVAYIRDLLHNIRKAEDAAARKAQKKGASTPTLAPNAKRHGRIYVATSFPEWQERAAAALKETWNETSKTFDGSEKQALGKLGLLKDKRVMPFVNGLKKQVETDGPAAFDRTLPFNEKETLQAVLDLVQKNLNLEQVTIVTSASGEWSEEDTRKMEASVPGAPTYRIWAA